MSVSSLFYWARRVSDQTSVPRIVQLVPKSATIANRPASPSLVVRMGDIHVEVAAGFDSNLLVELVSSLRKVPR